MITELWRLDSKHLISAGQRHVHTVLRHLSRVCEPGGFPELAEQRRSGKLPSHVTAYLVTALCLFSDDGAEEVAQKATGSLSQFGVWDAAWGPPASSGIIQARKRLGRDVLRGTFSLSGGRTGRHQRDPGRMAARMASDGHRRIRPRPARFGGAHSGVRLRRQRSVPFCSRQPFPARQDQLELVALRPGQTCLSAFLQRGQLNAPERTSCAYQSTAVIAILGSPYVRAMPERSPLQSASSVQRRCGRDQCE